MPTAAGPGSPFPEPTRGAGLKLGFEGVGRAGLKLHWFEPSSAHDMKARSHGGFRLKRHVGVPSPSQDRLEVLPGGALQSAVMGPRTAG